MECVSLMYEDAARQSDQEPACLIGDPDMPLGHQGHHMHQVWTGTECSCGVTFGVCCYVFPFEWTAEDWVAWEQQNVCSVCGKKGVIDR